MATNERLEIRYFTLDHDGAPPAIQAGAPIVQGPRLRLGRVVGAAHLREKIVYRNDAHELGFYEGLRWSERPESYVRRALARALFEERGLTRVVSGSAPNLEVELRELSDLHSTPRMARVEINWRLSDDRETLFEETSSFEEPVMPGGDEAAALVRALGTALDRGIEAIATAVVTELTRESALPPEQE